MPNIYKHIYRIHQKSTNRFLSGAGFGGGGHWSSRGKIHVGIGYARAALNAHTNGIYRAISTARHKEWGLTWQCRANDEQKALIQAEADAAIAAALADIEIVEYDVEQGRNIPAEDFLAKV